MSNSGSSPGLHQTGVQKLDSREREDNRDSFIILLSYIKNEKQHIVWPQMPVALLVEAAVLFVNECDIEHVKPAHVILMHDRRYLDPTCDCLSTYND